MTTRLFSLLLLRWWRGWCWMERMVVTCLGLLLPFRSSDGPLLLHSLSSLLVQQSQKMIYFGIIFLVLGTGSGLARLLLMMLLIHHTGWMVHFHLWHLRVVAIVVVVIVVDRIIPTVAAVIAGFIRSLQTQAFEGMPRLFVL